jgi:hypothetical protein
MDPKVESQIKGTSKSQKTKIRHVSLPIITVEAVAALRISPLLVYNLLSDSKVIS